MPKLNNLAILCAINSRSVAYLDILKKKKLLPSTIILIDVKKSYRNLKIKKNKYFETGLNLNKYALQNNIKLIKIKNKKINDNKCLAAVKSLREKYIIYAANYGDILSKKYFNLGKKFIHVHPGKLPQYKGSTTFYYEILQKNSVSYSVIFQNVKIDHGKIIYSHTFKLKNKKISKSKLDHVFDPYLRSLVLAKVINKLKKFNKLVGKKQRKRYSKIYYIIHPLLKHISILAKPKLFSINS